MKTLLGYMGGLLCAVAVFGVAFASIFGTTAERKAQMIKPRPMPVAKADEASPARYSWGPRVAPRMLAAESMTVVQRTPAHADAQKEGEKAQRKIRHQNRQLRKYARQRYNRNAPVSLGYADGNSYYPSGW
jgi:hypothetical protein